MDRGAREDELDLLPPKLPATDVLPKMCEPLPTIRGRHPCFGARKRNGEDAVAVGSADLALPTTEIGDGVDEREEWIRKNAASLRQILASPEVRGELLELLGGDGPERRRERRLEAIRRDLASMELRLKLAEDEVWEPSK
jgi:hypothetical protein